MQAVQDLGFRGLYLEGQGDFVSTLIASEIGLRVF